MLDTIIKGGMVIDGTGSPARQADIGIKGDRIVAVGRVEGPAARVIDAAGLLVTPGFVDVHTHYDAQLFWDPYATPSGPSGVTSVIAGNCGFSLAPLQPRDADFLRRMLAQVEGMPLEALENGLSWDWRTFADFLSRFEGKLGVNAAFMVGHTAIRRSVMGEAATGNKASPEQVDQMVELLHECLDASGLGLSTSLSYTHIDGAGRPVPSRFADWESEVVPLYRAVGDHPGTTLEFIIDGCGGKFSDAEIDLMKKMSVSAKRLLNWNILHINADAPDVYSHQMDASRKVAEAGGWVSALTMPVNVPNTVSFLSHCVLHILPGWGEVLRLPVPERIEALRKPEVRKYLMDKAHSPEAGQRGPRTTRWERYTIGATFAPENAGMEGRNLGEIAKEQGKTPTDCIFDIVVADELKTALWPNSRDDSPESWAVRKDAWNDDYILLGGSDAGAHLDRMCGAAYPAAFIADCLHGKKLVPVERAVRMMTQLPARHFGLVERGELREGWKADITVIDPARVGATPVQRADDLPGGAWRLVSVAKGVEHVLVNGRAIVSGGGITGDLPGQVLRSGIDTYTVTPKSAALERAPQRENA